MPPTMRFKLGDFVRAGLLLPERHEDEEAARLDRLRQEIGAGFEAIERGECVELRDDELDDYVERIAEAAAGARSLIGR